MSNTVHVLIGSPRSGLDVLCKCLGLLGLNALDQNAPMSAAMSDNLLIEDLGLLPHTPALPADWLTHPAAVQARERMGKIVSSMPSRKSSMGADGEGAGNLGDSRNSGFGGQGFLLKTGNPLVLPLWVDVLSRANLEVRYVFVLRHPWEVALSLGEHHSVEPAQGLILWFAQTRAALRSLEGRPHTLITFDGLLADPVNTLKVLCPCIAAQNDGERADTRVLVELVQPSLKHHHAGDMPQAARGAFGAYNEFYGQIRMVGGAGKGVASVYGGGAGRSIERDSGRAPTQGDQGLFQPLWSSSDVVDSLLSAIGKEQKQENLQTSNASVPSEFSSKEDMQAIVQRIKDDIKKDMSSEFMKIPPNPYAHNRTLTPAMNKSLRDFAEKQLKRPGLNARYMDYLAYKAVQVELNCVGRLATTIQDAIVRQLVVECVPGEDICIVEIGSLYGVSLAILYNHVAARFHKKHVIGLDPLHGFYGEKVQDALLNIPITDTIVIRNMNTCDVPETDYTLIKHYSTEQQAMDAVKAFNFNVLVIDGDHSYEGVKFDFDHYFPLLQPGGYVIFDDYNAKEWPGVQKFIDQDAKACKDLEFLGALSRTAVGKKKEG